MSREELIAAIIAILVGVATRFLDRWLPKDADTTGRHIRASGSKTPTVEPPTSDGPDVG